MHRGQICSEAQSYAETLEWLKTCFPSPVSDPIMDGYFVHTISHFLDHVDSLKSLAPVLGVEEKPPSCQDGREEKGEQTQSEGILDLGSVMDFPEHVTSVEDVTELIAGYLNGMNIWAHPNSQVNVIPPSSIPSIMAFIGAAIYNPNIIWDEYSALFAQAEIEAISMVSNLVGYDPRQSGGIFTFGGTGTIFYGCKMGLEKALGGRGNVEGVREDLNIIASQSSHYSHLNVAAWLGIGTRNLVLIPTNQQSEISLSHLEEYLRRAFEEGTKVAAILATMGTTDAFGIDDLGAIVRLRDRLAVEYELEHPPHIHADSVIGWIWSVFRDYDFLDNPMGFRLRTLQALQDSIQRISTLAKADSFGIDFHKTGYAPYISSAFLVKDRKDLVLLSREPDRMPYLYQFGQYHPGIYTMETSRSGAGALAALANMRLLGKQGYRTLIGHIVEMAELLRQRLEEHRFIRVINEGNKGPVTLFRVYPDKMEAKEVFRREMNDPRYREYLLEHNEFNREIFHEIHKKSMRGEGVLLSWTDAFICADYPYGPPIASLKSFIMSPWTDEKAIDTVVREVVEAKNLFQEKTGF
ncbi:L-aspartate decarboxylase [uncultured archaeon]|nr:L-aspartate decarboxylase [uncultured archaeon]